jgi:hypothetical protein
MINRTRKSAEAFVAKAQRIRKPGESLKAAIIRLCKLDQEEDRKEMEELNRKSSGK